jgi:hypothetical protein
MEYLLNFPTLSSLSCKDYLNVLIDAKIGKNKTSNVNATLCATHDLAPAIAKIYGI